MWQGAVLVRSSCSQRTLMPFAASTKKVAMAADAAMISAAMISLISPARSVGAPYCQVLAAYNPACAYS